MKPILPCFLILTLVSCVQWKEPAVQQQIIYTDTYQAKWKQEMLDRCTKEVAILAVAMYDAKIKVGNTMSKEEFKGLVKMLTQECSKYYGIMI